MGQSRLHTKPYLKVIGVREIPALSSPVDPGYDPATIESHLEQSAHLMSGLKMSMSCWMLADEVATRRKISAAKRHNVPVIAGGTPFEIAVAQGQLPFYLDLCADIGISRIEAGEVFNSTTLRPVEVVRMVRERGLALQVELGRKHDGVFTMPLIDELIERGRKWLDAGALDLVVKARTIGPGVGLFVAGGQFNSGFADRFARAFGLERLMFEGPTQAAQFALLYHFGCFVRLSNVKLEDLLLVEICRRGLHSDAFDMENLRPRLPVVGFS